MVPSRPTAAATLWAEGRRASGKRISGPGREALCVPQRPALRSRGAQMGPMVVSHGTTIMGAIVAARASLPAAGNATLHARWPANPSSTAGIPPGTRRRKPRTTCRFRFRRPRLVRGSARTPVRQGPVLPSADSARPEGPAFALFLESRRALRAALFASTHDFPMPKVRAALRFTGEKLGARRPLIEETFYSDGSSCWSSDSPRSSTPPTGKRSCAAFSSTRFAVSSAGPTGVSFASIPG